jgi:hypothetical protein
VDGWAEEWAGGRWCVRYGWIGGRKDGHKGGVKGPLLMKQKKEGKIILSFTSPEKDFFFYIYEVFVKQK